jgi:hypothetical protein
MIVGNYYIFIKVASWSIMLTHFFSLLPKVGQAAPCASTSCANFWSEWMLEKAGEIWNDSELHFRKGTGRTPYYSMEILALVWHQCLNISA